MASQVKEREVLAVFGTGVLRRDRSCSQSLLEISLYDGPVGKAFAALFFVLFREFDSHPKE
jgi:hypothetical protein